MDDASGPLRRQYVRAALLFVVLFVATSALFSALIVHELSRSTLEDILVTGADAGDPVAAGAGGGAMLHVVEVRRETVEEISRTVSHREIVETVQVFDARGRLVTQTSTFIEGHTGGFPDSGVELLPPPVPGRPTRTHETRREYDVPATVGSLDKVLVRVPQWALEQRIARLRGRLILHTALAAGVGLAVLALAVVFIWHLVARNAQLESRRRHSEELAALGRLGANLAHEIRNPLNALSLNLEMLAEDVPPSGGAAESVALAHREVSRLSRLVNDFLAYARNPAPVREPFAAAELLRDTVALLAVVSEQNGIEVVVEGDAEVVGDRAQLHQVLLNLAQNACQAMAGRPVRRLVLRAVKRGADAVIDVEDTGCGIPRDELARVREAFYSRRRGGTGLGLAIAERIVQAHGGRLELSNRAEGGLLARVVLPAAPIGRV